MHVGGCHPALAFALSGFVFESEGILDSQTDKVLTRHEGCMAGSNLIRLSWSTPMLHVELFGREGQRLHEASLNLDG